MGEGRKKGPGGGGNPLNYKVVGNPQPANPKDNTIWLNTDVKITGHSFVAEQPENMAEGEVWFKTSDTSPGAFNALKENNITVYPIKTMQMVSGTLVDVKAKIWQDGAWVEWFSPYILYSLGDEGIGITGGWVQTSYAGVTGGKVTKNEDSITLTADFSGNIAITTKNAIDMSGYSILKVKLTGCTPGNHSNRMIVLSLHSGSTPTENNRVALASTSGSVGELVLSVNDINESYWVSVACLYGPSITFNEVIRE